MLVQHNTKSLQYLRSDAQTTTKLVNIERTDRWHLCECGLPFPRGLPIVARLLVCPCWGRVGGTIGAGCGGGGVVVLCCLWAMYVNGAVVRYFIAFPTGAPLHTNIFRYFSNQCVTPAKSKKLKSKNVPFTQKWPCTDTRDKKACM